MKRLAQEEIVVTHLNGDGKGASCYWCSRRLQSTRSNSSTQATRDHLYPKSLGGNYRVWCCVACNNLKGALRPNEWRAFMAANPNWWTLWRSPRVRHCHVKRSPATMDFSPERARTLAREIVRKQYGLPERLPRPLKAYEKPPVGPVDIFGSSS